MAIFDRFKKEEDEKTTSSAKTKKTKTSSSKKGAAKSTATVKASEEKTTTKDTRSVARSARYADVLVKPHVSEKAAILAERGIYVFDVALNANKVEVKKAVEAIYGVSVADVRMQRGIGKEMRRGRIAGRRGAWKKALVELKKGQTLNLIEGV